MLAMKYTMNDFLRISQLFKNNWYNRLIIRNFIYVNFN